MDAAGLLAVAAPVGVAPQELPDEGVVPGLLDGVGDVAEVPERPLAVADAAVDDEDRALDDGRDGQPAEELGADELEDLLALELACVRRPSEGRSV